MQINNPLIECPSNTGHLFFKMLKFPKPIYQFLQTQSVMNIAVYSPPDFWAASCFYVFDSNDTSLIFFSSLSTKHAKLMKINPIIVGTIATQTNKIDEIEGIQFKGEVILLKGMERKVALKQYYARYPFARLMATDLWKIQLHEVKHSSNKPIFSKKIYWYR